MTKKKCKCGICKENAFYEIMMGLLIGFASLGFMALVLFIMWLFIN